MKRAAGHLKLATQELLVALICFHSSKHAQAARKLVAPKSFDPYFRQIVESAEAYWERYKKPPGEHTSDLIDAIKEREPDNATQYSRILLSLFEIKDGINAEFVLRDAGVFVRRQKAKAALQKAIPLLAKSDEVSLTEAEALFASVGKTSVEITEPGILLNDPRQALRFLDNQDEDVFPCGVKEIDKLKLGPFRGGLWIGVAPPNRGKTWMACHIGKHCMRAGKRVLHVTLEMSDKLIARRYVQGLFSVSKRKADRINTTRFTVDEDGRFIDFGVRTLRHRPHFEQDNIRKVLTRKMKPLKNRAKLIIKRFPTGQLTIRELNAYLDYLAAVHSFIPDVLLIDYPDLMDLPVKNKREALGKVYVDCRGIAVERNIAVVAFSQSNKLGLSTKIIDLAKLAEDFSKSMTADIIFSYNQTDDEQAHSVARLFAAKARDEVKHFQVLISQALDIGQFCMDSWMMKGNEYWSAVSEDEEEDNDDKPQSREGVSRKGTKRLRQGKAVHQRGHRQKARGSRTAA